MNFEKEERRFNAKGSKVVTDNGFVNYVDGSKKKRRLDFTIPKLKGIVLDVGIGDGLDIYLMLKNENISCIYGIDIHDKAIAMTKERVDGDYSLFKGFVEKMPFEDKSFDSIHIGATLEHVMDDEKALQECKRVLMGNIVISVPIGWPPDGIQHVRSYTKEGAIGLFNKFFTQKDIRMFDDVLLYEGI